MTALALAVLAVLSGSAADDRSPAVAPPSPPWPFFALCMDTHDAKKRDLEAQAALLKELGYAGAGHLWLDGFGAGTSSVDSVKERLRTLDAAGLRLFQVYVRVDVGAAVPWAPRLRDAIPLLHGRGVQLAVLMGGAKPSDESRDARAVEVLREIAGLARPHGVKLALYPHVGEWLEKVEDAVRVARKTDRPEVGAMFNLCHWQKVSEDSKLRETLKLAKPYLFAVTINGSDLRKANDRWILPLDQGSFDGLDLLRALREIGFEGPIGLQCYGIPGDARDHLQRSMAAWKKLREDLRPR